MKSYHRLSATEVLEHRTAVEPLNSNQTSKSEVLQRATVKLQVGDRLKVKWFKDRGPISVRQANRCGAGRRCMCGAKPACWWYRGTVVAVREERGKRDGDIEQVRAPCWELLATLPALQLLSF